MTLSRNLARPLMSSIFIVGPVTTLRNTSEVAKKAEPVTGPIVRLAQRAGIPITHDPELLVRINAGVQLAGAAALATGRYPRLAAGVLAVTLVPTTLAGHRFWEESDPAVRAQQRLQFAKNLSLLGGLMVAALDTEGKPGKAWLTRHAAKQLSKRADHLATTARLETKIAALEAAGAGEVMTETLTTAGKAARESARGLGGRLQEKAPGWAATAGAAGTVAAARSHDLGSRLADTAAEKAPGWAASGRAAGGDVLARSHDLGSHAAEALGEWGSQAADKAGDWRSIGRARAKKLRKAARAATKDMRKELAKQARKNAKTWKASVQRELDKALASVA